MPNGQNVHLALLLKTPIDDAIDPSVARSMRLSQVPAELLCLDSCRESLRHRVELEDGPFDAFIPFGGSGGRSLEQVSIGFPNVLLRFWQHDDLVELHFLLSFLGGDLASNSS